MKKLTNEQYGTPQTPGVVILCAQEGYADR